jgi:LuxR family maltose regulon positive regulatory protein
MHLVSGELAEALSAISEHLGIAINTNNAYAVAHSSYLLGLHYFYRNELDAAIRYLSQAEEDRYILISVNAVDAMAALVYTYQAMHMPDKAHATLARLQEYSDSLGNPIYTTIAQSCKTRLSIMQGKAESAYRLLKTNEPPDPKVLVFWVEIPALTHCRVLLAEGSSASLGEADTRLQKYLCMSEANHNTCQMIAMMPLLALTYEKQGRDDEALSILERALILAQPGGFIRPFLEPGPPVADLLKRLKKENGDTGFIDQILTVFKQDEEEGVDEGSDVQAPPPPAERAQPLIEPLTDRELETLEFLNQGLYRKEIADKLCISPETVKTHLKNVYQKLGVGTRREAVSRARALGILPRP